MINQRNSKSSLGLIWYDTDIMIIGVYTDYVDTAVFLVM